MINIVIRFSPLVLATMACMGSIAEPDDAPSQPEPGAIEPSIGVPEPGDAPTPGGPGTAPPVKDAPIDCTDAPRPALLAARRLTAFEYDGTIAHLFGKVAVSAEAFPSIRTLGDNLTSRYWEAAGEIATQVVNTNLGTFLGGHCDPGMGATDEKCLTALTGTFLRRAYRRTPDAAEVAAVRKVYQKGRAAADMKNAVRVSLSTVLQTPQFLYLSESGAKAAPDGSLRLPGVEVASRLSYALLGAPPPDPLLTAAENGELDTTEGVRAAARRLFMAAAAGAPEGQRLRARVRDFLAHWSEAESLPELTKDAAFVKGFTSQIASDMRGELMAFLEHAVWSQGGGVRTLLTAPVSFLTPGLAKYYGMTLPPGAGSGLTRVDLDGVRRAGLLTQGGLLSLLATQQEGSPIHRGKFVAGQLLCNLPPPPPPGTNAEPPKPSTSTTMRARLAAHSADPSCAACHAFLDPIGLGLEHFDAAGRWRDTEAGRPVDASGRIPGVVDGAFTGAVELGRKIADHPQVAACLLGHWNKYAFARDLDAEVDRCTTERLRQRVARSGRFEDILLAFVESEVFALGRVR